MQTSPHTYALRPTELVLDRSWNKEYILTVRDMPIEERPREKLQSQGPEALSIKELLAIVLMTGTVKEDLLEMSGRVIREYGERAILSERDPQRLSAELGIPLAKACQIVACGELGRRFFDKNLGSAVTIRTARDVYEYLQDMRTLSKEHIRGLYLNSRNRLIRDEVISIGTVSANIIHPREVFRPALEASAVAVILAHNHPSGDAQPSPDDLAVTAQLAEAGKILGITLLDHVIIAADSFRSIHTP